MAFDLMPLQFTMPRFFSEFNGLCNSWHVGISDYGKALCIIQNENPPSGYPTFTKVITL
jgi:hypothetical protein